MQEDRDITRYVAAYVHLTEVVEALDGHETEVAESLQKVADWLRSKYGIEEDDVHEFVGIAKLIGNGVSD